jgi:hypothetical protein
MTPEELIFLRDRLDRLEAKLDRLLGLQTAGADFSPGSPAPDDPDLWDLLGETPAPGSGLDINAANAAVKGGQP